MLPDRPATPSGNLKLLFLALAILVILAQTSPGNQLHEKREKIKSGVLLRIRRKPSVCRRRDSPQRWRHQGQVLRMNVPLGWVA